MYGDATAIRDLARQLHDRAGEIRATAAQLARQVEDVDWEGAAADAMRHQAGIQLQALRQTACLHDDAADALERHAREVQRLQDLIAAIERRARGIIGSLLSHLHMPPPGHLAWLSVDLPGLP